MTSSPCQHIGGYRTLELKRVFSENRKLIQRVPAGESLTLGRLTSKSKSRHLPSLAPIGLLHPPLANGKDTDSSIHRFPGT